MTASGVTEPLALNTDYTLELITETKTLANGSTKELETGFRIKLQGAYQTTSATITANFKTSFDVSQQIALGSSSSRLVMQRLSIIKMKPAIRSRKLLNPILGWIPTGLKMPWNLAYSLVKGKMSPNDYRCIWSESRNYFWWADCFKRSSLWMGLFNTYKEKINKDAIITDQLQEGQTLKDLALYTVTVTGYTTQVRALKSNWC